MIPIRKIASQCALAAMVLCSAASLAWAQDSWANLQQPPAGSAAPGDVLSAGHLGRQVGNVELMIHFYHDLLGMGLLGRRDQARPFGSQPALLEFVQLGEGVPNPMDARNRAVILPIPGTGTMTVEAIEIKEIESHPYQPRLDDPGSSRLLLLVRDLDRMLARLQDELVPIVTRGEKPVVLPPYPGLTGTVRAALVRDPDGYPVELLEITPAPPSAAPADSSILGARVQLIVDDLETTCRWFQRLVGPDFRMWAGPYIHDPAYEQLTGIPGEFRTAMALVPGSPVVMEFLQYQDHRKKFVRPHFQDPGAAHFLFMAKDDDVILQRVRSAGLQTLSKTGGPVFLGPVTRSFFVPNPDGFWAEFMDHDVKKQP